MSSKFSSIMYMAVSIVMLVTMLFYFINALLRDYQAKLSFVLALYVAVYYVLPNLIQAGVIEFTTGLIPLYEYVYECSVYIDLSFVIVGWISLRGGNEWAGPTKVSGG